MGNFGGKTMADFGGMTMYGRLETDFGRTGNDFSRYVPRHVNNTTYDFYHWLIFCFSIYFSDILDLYEQVKFVEMKIHIFTSNNLEALK